VGGRGRKGGGGRGGDIPALEWAAAALGLLLLAGAIGFLVRQAFVADEAPGPIALVVKQVRPLGGGFLVELEARNGGDLTYAELEVEGRLRASNGVEERASATLDYLPGRSRREAGLFFRADPSRGELVLAPKGFRRP
jgi:uncharacterized protein (TIGR02588 family)